MKLPPYTWHKRLLAVENALREQARQTRPFPDYEHLESLLRLNRMPDYLQSRIQQVIEGIPKRLKLEAERNSAGFEPCPPDAKQPELPLGLPDWFSDQSQR